MTFWSEIRPRVERVLKSYRFRHGLFSLFFGLCVVVIYYLINWLIPHDYLMHNQVVTILFIIVAVLVLFPAREKGLLRIMQRNEYTAFFGRDFHHLDVVARQFTVETLVNEVFPEFMEWLGVRQGRIAILNPDRKHYDYYVYRNQQVHRSRVVTEQLQEGLVRGLKNYRRSIHVYEFGLTPALQKQLEEMGAVMVQPFHYRNRLLGFLTLNEPPRNRHAARALDFFANKAAVSIQNHILTNRIIDSRLYDQELLTAQKIQSTLHDTPMPEIPGFRLVRHNHQASILEFFPARQAGHWFLVGLTLDRLTSPGGIILYSMLGSLYSFITRETHFTMHRVLGHLRKHREQLQSAYPLTLFVAELISADHSLIVAADGREYDIRPLTKSQRARETSMISSGARNFLVVQPDQGLVLLHGETPLLEIYHEELPDHPSGSSGTTRLKRKPR